MEDSNEMRLEENKLLSEKNVKRRFKTPAQVMALENFYNEHKYPTEELKQQLAEQIGLTEKQVSGWFCHRRLKEKRLSTEEAFATGRQDRSSGIVQDHGSGLRQDSCCSTKQGNHKNVDAREVESRRLYGHGYPVADLAGDHRTQFTGHVSVLDDTSSESSSYLQDRFYSQNKDPLIVETSRFTREDNGAIVPTNPNKTKNKEYKPSGYLKVKGETENAAITAVKRQLGRQYREDGPPLGTEFEPLPPGSFESASSNPMNEPSYVGNSKWPHSPDLPGVQKQRALGTRREVHSSNTDFNDLYAEEENRIMHGYSFSYGENSPDKVYAVGICRPDMNVESCRNCISEASKNITSICPKFKLAIAGFDDDVDNNCMLRYANYKIFGLMQSAPYFFVHSTSNMTENLVEFNQTRKKLLEKLISEAAARNSPKKYAVGDEVVTGILRLYALVQCNPDLSKADCNSCLDDTTKLVPECCDKMAGGRVITPSCSFRYETSKFYNSSIEGPAVSPTPLPNPKGKKNRTVIIVVCSVVGSVILILFIGCSIFLRMRKTEGGYENMKDIQNRGSLQFNFSTIRDATDNFSDANKLGQGGFGAVYKGVLSDGEQIAVKRLAMNSKQGDLEFKNEVIFVAKLQHRNLVRLLGFCLERKERILVYEFLPNSSLDHFIFDPIKREFMQWEKRYKIIEGIARGLQYLHEDSRLRIIHRDLKTSNVLLDSELNPKISDFGMARLFEMDQTQSDTNRVVGTFGYMAPEYVQHGRISVKSDVYSFGALVLEIMSGQKISSFGTEEETEGLLSYAWKNWNEGTDSNVLDPTLREGSTDEMKKCIHIGLLCVQENVSDRPTMGSVVVMLNSENVTLPAPSKPGFFLHNSVTHEASSSSSSSRNCYSGSTKSDQVKNEVVPVSRNDVTITELHPR